MTTFWLIVAAIVFLGMAWGIFHQLRSSEKKIAAARATPTSSTSRASSMSPGEAVEVREHCGAIPR